MNSIIDFIEEDQMNPIFSKMGHFNFQRNVGDLRFLDKYPKKIGPVEHKIMARIKRREKELLIIA